MITTKNQVQSLICSGHIEKANELCISLCHPGQRDSQIWMLLGFTYLQLGEAKKAERACEMAVKLNPDDLEARNFLSQALIEQKRFVKATDIVRKLVNQKPNVALLHAQLASLLYTQKHLVDAEEHYLQAIKLDSSLASAHISYGSLLCEKGDYHGAIDQFQDALDIESDNAEVHFRMGSVFNFIGQLDKAINCFKSAISYMPGKSDPYIALAKSYKALGNHQQAEEAFRSALVVDPGNGNAWHGLGICIYNDHDLEPAASAFGTALDINPENDLARCFLGVIQAQRGNYNEADVLLKKAAENSALAAAIAESYKYAANSASQARYFSTTARMLEYAVDMATLEGLYLEFGVYYGSSIRIIANKSGKLVHGFDSFEGIPESWEVGRSSDFETEAAGSYSANGELPDTPSNVQLHPGFFKKSLPRFVASHPGPVAFMNIDCDLYSSTITIFNNFEKQITSGTILLFDEYFCYSTWQDNEYKAFQEFIARSAYSYKYIAFSLFTGQVAVQIL